jgi:hypothetical protein
MLTKKNSSLMQNGGKNGAIILALIKSIKISRKCYFKAKRDYLTYCKVKIYLLIKI